LSSISIKACTVTCRSLQCVTKSDTWNRYSAGTS
jgi:hypothetical protein